MRRLQNFGLVLLALAMASAQPASAASMFTRIAPPAADPAAIPLYRGAAPGDPVKEPEVWDLMQGQRVVRNVSVPTITPVLPAPGKATGAAVIVVPGGGFKSVAMDGEGWPTAHWLADHGVAAFVLKYRVNETPGDEAAFTQQVMATIAQMARGPDKTLPLVEPRATADVLQAIKLVRAGATAWKIDPARVGVIGFSAGAVATLDAATVADPAARPAFVGHIYGPMVAIAVPPQAPPLFAALAMDDPLFGGHGFGIVDSWHKAGRPVELHAYEKGGHGFGPGKPGTTTTLMLPEFLAWMDGRGLLTKSK